MATKQRRKKNKSQQPIPARSSGAHGSNLEQLRSQALRLRYDAARTSIENERWWAAADGLSSRSANNTSVRKVLRQRSRYEVHEANSFARGIVVAKTNDVIGTGPVLQATSSDRSWNEAVDRRWTEWTRQRLLWHKLWTAFVAYLVDGETFLELVDNPQSDSIYLDLRVTEADYWTDPWDLGTNPLYADGISYDQYGNVSSYKRLLEHPGEATALPFVTKVVPANLVIHYFRADRPGQVRGIPHLTPALPLFAELRRFRLATLAAAETAANFAAIMETNGPIVPDSVDAWLSIDLERRALMTIPGGHSVKQLRAEHPSTTHFEFVKSIMMEIGRCLQIPLNISLGSSGDYNFSSARLDYILYWQNCDIERSRTECCILDRVYDAWLTEATLVPGYLPRVQPSDFNRHQWRWPPRYPVDPTEQANVDQIYWRMGVLPDADYFARQAQDEQEQYDKLRRMRIERERRGLPLPSGFIGDQVGRFEETEPTQKAEVPNADPRPNE